MKKLILFILLGFFTKNYAQRNEGLQIIDLSQLQLRLLNSSKFLDSVSRSKIFGDSVYKPHQKFWSGYVGKEENLVEWMNEVLSTNMLSQLNERNEKLNGTKLLAQLNEVKNNMQDLTGYSPHGIWYIVYSHGATNLGGLSTGEMLIDLSNELNNSNESIVTWFPHELTHQIMANVNKFNDSTSLGPVINEGFAVYVNQLYWGNKISLAQNFGFSEDELLQCRKHKKEIKRFFEKYKFSRDPDIIKQFRSRSKKINPELPGAIGYYIGYEIVKKYARKSSWKEVFSKPPRVIYELSGY